MAKTKKIYGDTDIPVTPKTKNLTYAYATTTPAVVDFKPNGGTAYTGGYNSYFYKKGNDLVYSVNFLNSLGTSYKNVTTTIKNYYTFTAAGAIKVGGTTKDLTTEAYTYYSNKTITNTTEDDKIAGSNKNNTYEIINLGNDLFYDQKGNDKYVMNASYESGKIKKIFDYSGNDKYYAYADAYLTTSDYKGNDKYFVNGGKGEFNDRNGNDKYDVTNNVDTFTIRDTKGKDEYKLHDSNNKAIVVYDNAGKDKYTVTNAGHTQVSEQAKSNDTYKYKNSTLINSGSWISDYGGKDKYTFEMVQGDSEKIFNLSDYGGKDKYTLKSGTKYINITDNYKITHSYDPTEFVGSGNDTYSLNSVSNIKIVDWGGKNKFTVKNSNDIDITTNYESNNKIDKTFNDSYTISGIAPTKKNGRTTEYSQNIAIADKSSTSKDTYKISYTKYDEDHNISHAYDWGGSDTYTLDHTIGFTIRDCETVNSGNKNKFNVSYSDNFKIYTSLDNDKVVSEGNIKTNDTYNIKASSGEISDYQGSNDKYNIKKLNNYIKIYDSGGNDTLKLADTKAKNLVFMCDYNSTASTLYIYDKKDQGFMQIDGFFTTTNDGEGNYNHTGYGNGKIETITAGNSKTNLVNSINMTQLDTLKGDVAGWLNDHNYYGNINLAITAHFENGADISQLIAYFDK